jgi:bacteriocin-like protein
MSDKPKQDKQEDAKKVEESKKPLTDAELAKVSGGQKEAFVKGTTTWVNLMAYRKKSTDAEPSQQKSVADLYEELAAE